MRDGDFNAETQSREQSERSPNRPIAQPPWLPRRRPSPAAALSLGRASVIIAFHQNELNGKDACYRTR